MKYLILVAIACIALFTTPIGAQTPSHVEVVVAWRTDGANGSTTPADAIAQINAYPTGALAIALGSPNGAQATFHVPTYPTHLSLPSGNADAKLAQYISLYFSNARYPQDRENILKTLSSSGKLGYVAEATASYGGLSQTTSLPTDEFFSVYGSHGCPTQPDGTQTGCQWQLLYPYIMMDATWYNATGWANIGVLDTGPYTQHPDLKHAFAFNNSYDFARGDRDLLYESNQELGFHGTHVTGIIAARANNPRIGETEGQGVAGVCWDCTILYGAGHKASERTDSARWIASWGAQVINLSGFMAKIEPGEPFDPQIPPDGTPCSEFNYDPNLGADPFCAALEFMRQRDVLFVAAAGNNRSTVQYPASDPYSIAVSGFDYALPGGYGPNDTAFWDEYNRWTNDIGDRTNGCPAPYNPSPLTFMECGSNYGPETDFIAPARHIISTVKPGTTYISGICSDASFSDPSDGYGFCTGTSMASPHVAALLGVLRSINPLLNGEYVLDYLKDHPTYTNPVEDYIGAGIPNPFLTAEHILGHKPDSSVDLKNRLTPMFVLQGTSKDMDRLYTAKPQVAVAAGTGELLAEPSCILEWPNGTCPPPGIGPSALRPYFSVSSSEANYVLNGFYYWPVDILGLPQARASFYVFTTSSSPFSGSELAPLARLSFAETCDWRSHTYSVSASDMSVFESFDFCDNESGVQSYKFEGIEGYILATCPPEFNGCNNLADPSVPQALHRRYSYDDLGYALILESQLTNPVFSSYTEVVNQVDVLGYVFPNVDTDGDRLIDGIERMIGTNRFLPDSDSDGILDRVEYPMRSIQ